MDNELKEKLGLLLIIIFVLAVAIGYGIWSSHQWNVQLAKQYNSQIK